MTIGRRTAILAMALAAVAAAAGATTLLRVPPKEAGRTAPLVVSGTVFATKTRLATVPGGGARIHTDYDLRSLVVWKGQVATRNLVVSMVGGTMGDVGLKVHGLPRLEAGGRYLLFVDPDLPICPVVGWEQGCFPLRTRADGVDEVLDRDLRPISAVVDGEAVTGDVAMSVEDFIEAVGAVRRPR